MNSRKRILMLTALTAMLLGIGGGVSKSASALTIFQAEPVATVLFATCMVPGTHATIQAAVNEITCTVIDVAPGAYAENVVINRPVTINGEKAGTPVAGRTFGAGESTLTGRFTVQAAGVTIDGFSLTNPGQGIGIVVKTAGNNALITNNIINGIGSPTFTPNTTAIYLEHGPDGVSVVGNHISNVQSVPTAQGILVGDTSSNNSAMNILIEGNTIEHIKSVNSGAYGVQVNNGAARGGSSPKPQTAISTIVVRDNTITALTGGGWTHAIGLEGDTPNAIVEGNIISNIVDLSPAPLNDAVGVHFQANPSAGTVEVHDNQFNLLAAQYGIAVHPSLSAAFPALSVDGECNWWNSPSGPTSPSNPTGTGAGVGPNVDFKPWQIAPNGACIGGNVPTDKNQCKNGGWMELVRPDGSTFKNQGDCIQYVNNGN